VFGAWLKFMRDSAEIGFRAQQVVALRLMKIAAGGAAANAEAARMVTEKLAAATEAAMILASGGSPQRVIGRTKRRVRANAQRLSRTRKKK
jgi:hypothetical protein